MAIRAGAWLAMVVAMAGSTAFGEFDPQTGAQQQTEPTGGVRPTPALREGRGIVFGMGLGAGQMGFGGDAEQLALFVGAGTGSETTCFYTTCTVTRWRAARVAPREAALPGSEFAVPFPDSQGGASLSMVVGWSFSNRIAALLDADLSGNWSGDGFAHLVVGLVLRYSPGQRWWVEAGPAFGELSYQFDARSYDLVITQSAARVDGEGLLAAVGLELMRRPSWLVDVQARYGTVWYTGLRTTNASLQLGIVRRRS